MSPTRPSSRISWSAGAGSWSAWRGGPQRAPNTLPGPFLQLKIGDVVRYLVAHTDRHLVQADRASC